MDYVNVVDCIYMYSWANPHTYKAKRFLYPHSVPALYRIDLRLTQPKQATPRSKLEVSSFYSYWPSLDVSCMVVFVATPTAHGRGLYSLIVLLFVCLYISQVYACKWRALVVKTTARHISTPGAMKRDETINTVPRVYIVCKMSCYHLVLAVTRSQSLYIRI